jgi:hypothetical protein
MRRVQRQPLEVYDRHPDGTGGAVGEAEAGPPGRALRVKAVEASARVLAAGLAAMVAETSGTCCCRPT